MTRFIFPSLFVLALMMSAPVYAADAQEAAKEAAVEAATEAQKQDAALSKKVEEKKAAEEPKEEKKAEEKKAEDEIPDGVKQHQKSAKEVFDQTKKIIEGLSPEEQKHFFYMYNNYNLIGTVKMVQGDVGNAVESCGKENPDLKEPTDARFKLWNEAVNPVIAEAEGNINNMILAQGYAKKADIEKIFKGLDKTRDLANEQIEKTPVTTKEACEYLLENMDDTQENFVKLLRDTLVVVPKDMPGTKPPEPKKAEATSEEKPAEEVKEEKPAEEPTAGEAKE